jgi:hypothetical protein
MRWWNFEHAVRCTQVNVWRVWLDLGCLAPDSVRGEAWPWFPDPDWSGNSSGPNTRFIAAAGARLRELFDAGAVDLRDVWRFSIAPNIYGQVLRRCALSEGGAGVHRFAHAQLGVPVDVAQELEWLEQRVEADRTKKVRPPKWMRDAMAAL